MMNYISNKMLRMFSEDAGSPELRTPELGRLSSSRKRAARKVSRTQMSPAICARMSYEQLKRI